MAVTTLIVHFTCMSCSCTANVSVIAYLVFLKIVIGLLKFQV